MALEEYASKNQNKVYTDVLGEARQACYKARDAFYACMQKESHKKPTEIAYVGLMYPAGCKQTRYQFEKQCRPSWVKHFDREYASKRNPQRLLDDKGSRKGPMLLPQPFTFSPNQARYSRTTDEYDERKLQYHSDKFLSCHPCKKMHVEDYDLEGGIWRPPVGLGETSVLQMARFNFDYVVDLLPITDVWS